MEHSRPIRRFRANPVEVAIFSVIALVFANSVYNLFYEHEAFVPRALVPMAARPLTEGNRQLASFQKTLLNLDISCEPSITHETSANKLRLNGTLCSQEKPSSTGKLIKTDITNAANHFNATIFMDGETGKFSTDYIPLDPGENQINLEFSFKGGHTYSQKISVNRSAAAN